jgi:transposase InsO family protein
LSWRTSGDALATGASAARCAVGTKINDKRVYRLYKLADLSMRKRRSKQRLKLERVPLHECQTINEVWSMDFVSDSLNRPGFRGGPLV